MPEYFGHFELDRLIGRGGMGEVHRAFNTSMNRRVVAIKRLRTDLIHDPDDQERFRRESALAASLDDEPHIIPIYSYGEINGQLFIEMRWIDGIDLHNRLATHGVLEPARAADIVEQVAQALDAAHAVDLVHRDVKQSNILLGKNDFAYLIDFGICRRPDGRDGSARRLTPTSRIVGTQHYMAPEQFDGAPADARSDVYSLACVMFEALTGEPPFPTGDLAWAHRSLPPPLLSATGPRIDERWDAVVARGMAKDPAARYRSAGELAAAARAVVEERWSTPAASSPGRTKPPPTKLMRVVHRSPQDVGHALSPRSQRRPLKIAGVLTAIAAIVAAVAAGIFYVFGGDVTVPVGEKPRGIALSPDGTRAYVVNSGSDSLTAINTEDLTTHDIPVGDEPRGVAVSPDGRRVYTANAASRNVSVVDTETRTVVDTIQVGERLTALVVAADGSRVYVGDDSLAAISVIDITARRAVGRVDLSDSWFAAVTAVAMGPDGNQVLATLDQPPWEQDVLAVIDVERTAVSARVDVSSGPRALGVARNGSRAYVAGQDSGTVSVVDLRNRVVLAAPAVAPKPTAVALSPDGQSVYVTNSDSGTVSMLSAETNTVSDPVSVGDTPVAVAVDPYGRRVYVVCDGVVSVIERHR